MEKMIAAFEALREEFRIFGTEGISIVLVCAAVLFFAAERDRMGTQIRKLTAYGVLFFVLLANPFGYHIIHSFWVEDYRNLFMLLLPVIFTAAAVTEFTAKQDRFLNRAAIALCCAGVVLASSFFDFRAGKLAETADMYAHRQEIEAVDQVIRDAGIVPRNMIAPREVAAGIREVNPTVQLLYGETLTEGILNKTVTAENEAEQAFLDVCTTLIAVPSAVDYRIQVAEEYKSNCILLENSYDETELMEKAGFLCYGRTENYAVYFKD